MLYWEDVETGSEMQEIGRIQVSREMVVRYAEKYDPQPFHLDEEAGRNSILGGMCASGWHACTLAYGIEQNAGGEASIRPARPDAIEEWRWRKPLFVNEWFILRQKCDEKKDSEQEGEGLCHLVWEAVNEKGEVKSLASIWRHVAKRPAI